MKMLNKKIITLGIAFAMMALAVPVAFVADDSSSEINDDPTAPYGMFNIYSMVGIQQSWGNPVPAYGYNAAVAVHSVYPNWNINMDYVFWNTNQFGSFWDINPDYGKISGGYHLFNGIGTPYAPYIFIYDDLAGQWEPAITDSLGFYKPFEDYDQDLRTANIAILHRVAPGTDLSGLPMPSINDLMPLVPTCVIEDNEDFEVTFYLTADSNVWLQNYPNKSFINDIILQLLAYLPQSITGYGSDTYLAFVDACARDEIDIASISNAWDAVNGQINSSYGAVQDILDFIYGQDPPGAEWPTPITYFYWSLYLGDEVEDDVYSDWLLGFMSPLEEASALNFENAVEPEDPSDPPVVTFDFVQKLFSFEYTYSPPM